MVHTLKSSLKAKAKEVKDKVLESSEAWLEPSTADVEAASTGEDVKDILAEAEEIKDRPEEFLPGKDEEVETKKESKEKNEKSEKKEGPYPSKEKKAEVDRRAERLNKESEKWTDDRVERLQGMEDRSGRFSTGELILDPREFQDLDQRYFPKMKDGDHLTSRNLAEHLVVMRKEIEDVEEKAEKLASILDSAAGEVLLSSGSQVIDFIKGLMKGEVNDMDDLIRAVNGHQKDSKDKGKKKKKEGFIQKAFFNFGASIGQAAYYRYHINKTSLPKTDKKFLKSRVYKYKIFDGLVGLFPSFKLGRFNFPTGLILDYISQSNAWTAEALDKRGDKITENLERIGIDTQEFLKVLQEDKDFDKAVDLAEEGIEAHALKQRNGKGSEEKPKKNILKKIWPFGKKG